MSYFIFNGIDSRQFGITSKLALPPLPERTLKTAEIPGRYEPLNRLDIMRKNMQITLTVSMPDVTKISEVNAWLQGKGDLILSDDLTKKYHAYVNMSIMPERISRRFGSIPIVFTVEPFRYSVYNPLEQTELTLSNEKLSRRTSIYLNGTVDSEPLFVVTFAGVLNLTVNGDTLTVKTPFTYKIEDGKYIYTYELQEIYLDSAAKVAYIITENNEKQVVTCQTSGRFPVLHHEDNEIILELVPDREDVTSNHRLEKFCYQKNERWY